MNKFIKIALSATALSFVYINVSKNSQGLPEIDIIKILPILLFSAISFLFLYLRFNFLATNLLNTKKSNKSVFTIYLNGLFLHQLPIPAGAEVYKIYDLYGISNQREKSFYAVLIERIAGLFSNATMLIIIFNFSIYEYLNKFYIIFLAFQILVIILIKFFYKFFFIRIPYFNYVYLSIRKIKSILKILTTVFAYSLVSQCISLIMIAYCLSLFYSWDLVFSVLFFVQLSNLIIALPVFISGWGVREFLYALIFSNFLKIDFANSVFAASIINLSSIVILISMYLCYKLFYMFFAKN